MEPKATIVAPDKEEDKSLSRKISDFISKRRVLFLSILGAILAVVLAVGAYTLITQSVRDNSSRALEVARAKVTAWAEETDEAKKAELDAALHGELDTIIAKWAKSFAAQQSLYIKASLFSSKQDWVNAEKYYLDAASLLPKTYLAPIALENAAVSAEEQGKADKAFEYYGKIIADYVSDVPNLAHAHFSLGRLSEAKQDWKAALEHYQKLQSDFASSDWALLAKNRIIFLKAQGYDKQ